MKRKNRVKNPIAHADGGVSEGKRSIIDRSKLRQTKMFSPTLCELYELPKYPLPDVLEYSPMRNNTVERLIELSLKYPSLNYVSVYGFSTSNNEVNTDVWVNFLDLYDRGYIKRIYDAINDYFQNDFFNAENVEYFDSTPREGFFLIDTIKSVITPYAAYRSDDAKRAILIKFIYDFIVNPMELFDVMYSNAVKFLEAQLSLLMNKSITIKHSEHGPIIQDATGEDVSVDLMINPQTIPMLMLGATIITWTYHRDYRAANAQKTTYSQAIRDNLKKKGLPTKSLSDSENEDERGNGDYPQGSGGQEGGGNYENKNSDRSIFLIAIAILVVLFIVKKKSK